MNAFQLKTLDRNLPKSPDEYLRMQITELGKRVEELKKDQHRSLRAFDNLRYEIIKYKNHNEKSAQVKDLITRGETVYTKSSRKGPFVTISQVALKVETDRGYARTVVGWVCVDKSGNFLELAEDNLTNELQSRPELESDGPILALILATMLTPIVLSVMALALSLL